jgi:hypothetical protein
MELSSTDPIFKILNDIKSYISDNKEVSLKFHNYTEWTEMEFDNFAKVFRNNYKEIIEDEVLEVTCDNNILKIFKIANIIKYCNTNNHLNLNHKWENIEKVKNESIKDLFDINLEFDVIKTTDIEEVPDFNNKMKTFKLIKNFRYDIGNGFEVVGMMTKSNDKSFNDLKKSKILNANRNYEFKLIIRNDNRQLILENMINVLKSFFMTNILLTKKQQKQILDDYTLLVKKDMVLPHYFNEVPLLTPKPITLEKSNLNNPDDYGAVSILKNYVVTEKADGERVLIYINNVGKVYIIRSSLKIDETGIIAKKEAFNSLIDGEYIECHKRTDGSNKNLIASFDLYYQNGESSTSLPLIGDKSRNSKMLKMKDYLDVSKCNVEFVVKIHRYSEKIFDDCKEILNNPDKYPYEIDGLIFTPAKLAVYSFYPSLPVPITQNNSWERLFKWKPTEQNTIDFLVKFVGDIKRNGIIYKKVGLYVGDNPISSSEISIEEGLKLRYDRKYNKKQYELQKEGYIPVLFRPKMYYINDMEFSYLGFNEKGEIRAENNDKIDDETIVEFRFDMEDKKWKPIRVREDKTKIYKKGVFTKTANSLVVAVNIWRSINNPISREMITGGISIKDGDDLEEAKKLEADDIYYSRSIPRKTLLSYNMITFHNIGINDMLFTKVKKGGNVLEMACGQASDLHRWISSGLKFVLGVDIVKDNIYNAKNGAYARVIREFGKSFRQRGQEQVKFPDIAFAVGDCTMNLRNGEAGMDEESKKLLKMIMNKDNKKYSEYYKNIVGRGAEKFDAITCLFAIHYFFENKKKLEGFLENVGSNLKIGGLFMATFMDGKSVEQVIEDAGGKIAEGRNIVDDGSIPIWAIIKRFDNNDEYYSRKVDIFIENTQRLIPEYLVNYDFLVNKALEFDLEVVESELYSTTFEKFKTKVSKDEDKQTAVDKIILELDKQIIQKKFSSLNRWVIFKKIEKI